MIPETGLPIPVDMCLAQWVGLASMCVKDAWANSVFVFWGFVWLQGLALKRTFAAEGGLGQGLFFFGGSLVSV